MPKTGIRPYETRTKGRRWLAYYDSDGRKVLRRGFPTSRAAERWRANALINTRSPADSRVTVDEWVTEWLDRHRTRVATSTYERYEGSIRLWIVPYIGMVRLTVLTHRHIEAMHDEALRAGRSPLTIRRNHTPLRLALQEAERDGIIQGNPATLVRLPAIQTDGTEPFEISPFTYDELQTFLDRNRDNDLYPIYHLALYSGLRLGEIMALRVGRDIDLTTGTLTVREKRRKGVTGPPKSKTSRRRVKLAPEATEVLGRAIERKESGELAFSYNPSTLTHSMDEACARAGLKRVRFHDLRHTHASLLLAAGENLKAVSARIGHADPGFTLRVYGHVMPGMDEELADATVAFGARRIKNVSRPSQNGAHEMAGNGYIDGSRANVAQR